MNNNLILLLYCSDDIHYLSTKENTIQADHSSYPNIQQYVTSSGASYVVNFEGRSFSILVNSCSINNNSGGWFEQLILTVSLQ